MKKFTLIILTLISINSFSQVLVENINEFTYKQNNNYRCLLKTYNTHFSSSDSNLILFTNYSDTVKKWLPSNYLNDTYLETSFNNSFSEKGYYDLYVYNNIDDTMFLEKALYVTDGNAKFVPVEINKCHTDSSYTLNITVLNLNLNAVTNSYAYFINKESDTIIVDYINKTNPNQLEFHFETNSNSFGVYSLFYFNNTDTIIEENTIYVENNNRTRVDSLNPDTIIYYNMYYDTITIYGNNTQFTNDTNLIYFDFRYSNFAYDIYSYQVINDTVIKIKASFIIGKYADSCDLISIYNPTDGLLQYPYRIGITLDNKDINKHNQIQLYPNPSSDILNIEFDNLRSKEFEIKIYTTDMKLIKSDVFNSNKYSMNISDFKKGLYFIEIISGENRFMQKFIKN